MNSGLTLNKKREEKQLYRNRTEKVILFDASVLVTKSDLEQSILYYLSLEQVWNWNYRLNKLYLLSFAKVET